MICAMQLYGVGHLEYCTCTVQSRAFEVGQTHYIKKGIITTSRYLTVNVAFMVGQLLTELRVLQYVKASEVENTN